MFSELVDEIIAASGRPEMQADIASYINLTILEARSMRFFYKDLVEDQLTTTAKPHIWTLPRFFRRLRTVYYPSLDVYPDFLQPGKVQAGKRNYYYAAAGYFVFVGDFTVGDSINYGYYQRSRELSYYAAADRPAVWDEDTETWTYLDPQPTTDDEREALRAKVTNWVLKDWRLMVREGVLGKVFNLKGDPRSRAHYAMYQTVLNGQFLTDEAAEAIAFPNK